MLDKPMLNTVMILSFQTDQSGPIVQTQITLLLEGQSDKGLYYLQYCLHLLDAFLDGKTFFPVLYIQTNCWYSDGYKLCSSCS